MATAQCASRDAPSASRPPSMCAVVQRSSGSCSGQHAAVLRMLSAHALSDGGEDFGVQSPAEAALDFVLGKPELAARVGEGASAAQLDGGTSNHAFAVRGARGAVFVKCAGPQHRVCGFAMPMSRLKTEAVSLRAAHAAAPDAVPKLLAFDPRASTIVTAFATGAEPLSALLARGAVRPKLGASLGAALAHVALRAAPAALPAVQAAELVAAAEANSELTDFMDALVFDHPYDAARGDGWWPAALDGLVRTSVHANAALLSEVEALKALRRRGDHLLTLCHTDLWPTNILVAAGGGGSGSTANDAASGRSVTRSLSRSLSRSGSGGIGGGGGSFCNASSAACATLVDFEFAALGPAALDIAHVLASFVHCALIARGHTELAEAGTGAAANLGASYSGSLDDDVSMVSGFSPKSARSSSGSLGASGGGASALARRGARRRQEAWLVAAIDEAWAAYCSTWRRVAAAAASSNQDSQPQLPAEPPALADVLGLAGLIGMRWTIGRFNVFKELMTADMSSPAVTAAMARAVIVFSAWIERRREFGSAGEAADAVRSALDAVLANAV